jgi:beta-lactamase class A
MTGFSTLRRLGDDGVTSGLHVVDIRTGRTLASWQPDVVLPSASAAKVLVLIEAARAVAAGEADLAETLDRTDVAEVGDSGLWQHLTAESLALGDVAQLVGAVSDNLATNVLLHRLGGVERVTRTAKDLGVHQVTLHDIVRDERTPEHPAALSTGSAHGYAELFRRLEVADGIPGTVADTVLSWLRHGTDLSMVAAAFGLDPLAHGDEDRGLAVVNKTGTDSGVRVDAGIVRGPTGSVAYACLAYWDEKRTTPAVRDHVLDAMRDVGAHLRRLVST